MIIKEFYRTRNDGVNLYRTRSDANFMIGDRVLYNDVLYKVLQDHVSQETWTPESAPSLFAKVLIPNENVVPEWEQPDSTNPYMAGDMVRYKGDIYVSTIDNNVWSPETSMWKLANT